MWAGRRPDFVRKTMQAPHRGAPLGHPAEVRKKCLEEELPRPSLEVPLRDTLATRHPDQAACICDALAWSFTQIASSKQGASSTLSAAGSHRLTTSASPPPRACVTFWQHIAARRLPNRKPHHDRSIATEWRGYLHSNVTTYCRTAALPPTAGRSLPPRAFFFRSGAGFGKKFACY